MNRARYLLPFVLVCATPCVACLLPDVDVLGGEKSPNKTQDAAVRDEDAGQAICGGADAEAGSMCDAGACGSSTPIGPDDGCCPLAANSNVDPDCKPACGNGAIEAGETCDPPGSCKECSTTEACFTFESIGDASTCTLRCERHTVSACVSGDDCCPKGCAHERDADCSPGCGNGIIDADETCEEGTSSPCPTRCIDDNPCTKDELVGSAANCSARCVHSQITEPKSDDACCPSGADANTDIDCEPICGNGIRERGEDCDGSSGCSATCKLQQSADQLACSSKLAADAGGCDVCTCMKCDAEAVACLHGPNEKENSSCRAGLSCFMKNNCFGTDCYCGSALFCSPPGGACRNEIESAAGTTDSSVISSLSNDPKTVLGRMYALDRCRVQQCASECRP